MDTLKTLYVPVSREIMRQAKAGELKSLKLALIKFNMERMFARWNNVSARNIYFSHMSKFYRAMEANLAAVNSDITWKHYDNINLMHLEGKGKNKTRENAFYRLKNTPEIILENSKYSFKIELK